MFKREYLARLILILLILAAVAVPLGARLVQRTQPGEIDVELHARMPENGGFSPDSLQAQVGQPIHLRMTSDDVLHGFAIGQDSRPPVDIRPGEYTETTLVFDQPGKYTFYCTHWCGPNHWRMRGTIEVTGPQPTSSAGSATQSQPLFLKLKLDLDAPHLAAVVPAQPPSAGHGAELDSRLPTYTRDRQTYLTGSPASLWQRLRSEASLLDLSDADLWDAAAYVWQANTTLQALQQGGQIYAQNCAACHGETGRGDGVMVASLPPYDPAKMQSQSAGMPGDAASMGNGAMRPPDLSDPHVLLGASPALLEGKITRGGMGTGMPYWGPILTRAQIEAVISYLYTFSQSLDQPNSR